jgi:hypothetical protein
MATLRSSGSGRRPLGALPCWLTYLPHLLPPARGWLRRRGTVFMRAGANEVRQALSGPPASGASRNGPASQVVRKLGGDRLRHARLNSGLLARPCRSRRSGGGSGPASNQNLKYFVSAGAYGRLSGTYLMTQFPSIREPRWSRRTSTSAASQSPARECGSAPVRPSSKATAENERETGQLPPRAISRVAHASRRCVEARVRCVSEAVPRCQP